MVKKICAFVVLALCILAGRSSAQDCVPHSVVNLTVDAHHYLSWLIREDEQCAVTSFLVHIFRLDHENEYAFSTTEQRVDVSFLEVCQVWTFVVIPISQYVRGPELRLVDFLPLPTNADLTLGNLTIITDETTEEHHLAWELVDDRYGHCTLKYRVTIEQNYVPIIEDVYVDDKFLSLRFLSPCTDYLYSVRAVNTARPIIEGPIKAASYTINSKRQGPPTLASVDAGATYLNLAFRLESFIRNPCPIREFSIDGGSSFNQSIPVTDGPIRPLVNVTIGSLAPNSMYILRASIQNSGGWSQPVIAAIQTPDLDPGKA